MVRIVAGRITAPMVIAVVFSLLYSALSILRFRRFETPSWDNAIFEQGISGYAHLGAPIVDIKGPGFNQLGDHFSPIIAFVAPFYRAFPAAQTLFVAQAVLIGLSAAVIAKIAIQRLGALNGCAIAIAYGLSFGIQAAVKSDFHEVAFAAPLLALAGAAFLRNEPNWVIAWSVPLLFVKEDMGLTVAAIGLVLWLHGNRRRGIVLAGLGIVSLVLILAVVIPFFNPHGTWDYSGTFGGNRSMLSVLLDDPGQKLATLALTFGITGFLAIFSLWAIASLPIIAGRFAGDNPYYWGTDWHYSLLLMPIVFVAMIDVIERLKSDPGERPHPWRRLYGRIGPLLALVIGVVMLFGSPLSALAQPQTYELNPSIDAARSAVAHIPSGTSVETDISLITHLVTDHTVYWIGTVGKAKPDYVAFGIDAGLNSPRDVVAYAESTHGGTYREVFRQDGFVVVKRR